MEREKTIDHALRATWKAVTKLYNEEAGKHDSTMAMAMALLYIDHENGTPSTSLGPSMGMEATSLSRLLISIFHDLSLELLFCIIFLLISR